MSIALGDMLKNAREAKGMSIEQVASVTRLNTLFIEALEEGRWDKLPGQVYLKPFTKTYAEALGLDLKEVYKILDGAIDEDSGPSQQEEPSPPKKRDYRLLIVMLIAVAVIILIYIMVDFEQGVDPEVEKLEVVPAAVEMPKKEIMWNRPWQKPALWEIEHPGSHRLRLEATDQVWASVLAGPDTLFAGFINPGSAKTLYSVNGFLLNLGRNDCVTGYIDGDLVAAIGNTSHGLYNFHLGQPEKRD